MPWAFSGSDVGRSKGSVAILGGGMGALTAAFDLTEGDWTSRFDRITVYQRGWRLGGKGASSRGPHGRIEEHGLHVLLGYYDHTFDVMRRCYEALDRERTDPLCPIRTWGDAVAPSNLVGVVDQHDGAWEPWVATFSSVTGRPGEGGEKPTGSPLAVADLVVRSLRLLLDFFASLPFPEPLPGGSIGFSTSPIAPSGAAAGPAASMAGAVQGAALIGLTLPLSWAERVLRQATAWTGNRDLERVLPSLIEPLRLSLRAAVRSHPGARRSHALVEIVTANLFGIVVDGLLTRPEGFGAINHLDYREWLLGNGIDPEALDSPILRGMYDLVFGYERGDPSRPRFSAGLGLELATKMLLGYSGALFWKMQAGMGEVVFAPLYEVLRDRGVEFRFFHRVDALRLADDGRSIAAIELGLQAELAEGIEAYEPLIRVKGLPCWPAAPLHAQLRDDGCARRGRPRVALVPAPRRRATDPAGGNGLRRRRVRHFPGHGAPPLRRAADRFPGLAVDGRERGDRRHPGTAALAVRGRAGARVVRSAGGDGERLRQTIRHLGVHAAPLAGRGLAGAGPTTDDRLLLRRAGHTGCSGRSTGRGGCNACRADAGTRVP